MLTKSIEGRTIIPTPRCFAAKRGLELHAAQKRAPADRPPLGTEPGRGVHVPAVRVAVD